MGPSALYLYEYSRGYTPEDQAQHSNWVEEQGPFPLMI